MLLAVSVESDDDVSWLQLMAQTRFLICLLITGMMRSRSRSRVVSFSILVMNFVD